MAKWIYNGVPYYTHPIGKYKYTDDVKEVESKLDNVIDNGLILMHANSKRLYHLEEYGYCGKGKSLKLYCKDIQTGKRYWFSSQSMEFVLTKI